jgi:hypothetical protein
VDVLTEHGKSAAELMLQAAYELIDIRVLDVGMSRAC